MEPTIQFTENALHTTRSDSSQVPGGVYPIRNLSRSRGRQRSMDFQKVDYETAEDEDAGLRDARDYKQKQVCYVYAVLFSGCDSNCV